VDALRAGAPRGHRRHCDYPAEVITARFVSALSTEKARDEATVIGIDLGGTNTKAAHSVACRSSSIAIGCADARPRPRRAAAAFARPRHSQAERGAPSELRQSAGIATAGGSIQIAARSSTLPKTSPDGPARIGAELESALQLPVAIGTDVERARHPAV